MDEAVVKFELISLDRRLIQLAEEASQFASKLHVELARTQDKLRDLSAQLSYEPKEKANG